MTTSCYTPHPSKGRGGREAGAGCGGGEKGSWTRSCRFPLGDEGDASPSKKAKYPVSEEDTDPTPNPASPHRRYAPQLLPPRNCLQGRGEQRGQGRGELRGLVVWDTFL